jgi:uncharacterized protein with PQ loop repeat
MTREQVADVIGWSWIVSAIGVLNVVAMLPQLVSVIRTRKTDGLSLQTFGTILLIQLGFAAHGFFTRDSTLMLSNGVAASVNLATIIFVISIRRAQRRLA